MHAPSDNRALGCCARFDGDVLLVDSEEDHIIPPPVIASYKEAFKQALSSTRYTLKGADHRLTDLRWQTS